MAEHVKRDFRAERPDPLAVLKTIEGIVLNAWLYDSDTLEDMKDVPQEELARRVEFLGGITSELYRLTHAYNSPECNENHPEWFDAMLAAVERRDFDRPLTPAPAPAGEEGA